MIDSELGEILRFLLHYGLHFLAPGLFAFLFYRTKWKKVWLIFLATMLVDLDHLLANPIFDPDRCSINFHLFHTYWAILLYVFMLLIPKLRIMAIGLLFHMLTDFIDCQLHFL
jgi:hypothetical protein